MYLCYEISSPGNATTCMYLNKNKWKKIAGQLGTAVYNKINSLMTDCTSSRHKKFCTLFMRCYTDLSFKLTAFYVTKGKNQSKMTIVMRNAVVQKRSNNCQCIKEDRKCHPHI